MYFFCANLTCNYAELLTQNIKFSLTQHLNTDFVSNSFHLCNCVIRLPGFRRVPALTLTVQKCGQTWVTFASSPNGSHSLWTNCVGKPRQACDRWLEWTGECWQCVQQSWERIHGTERDQEEPRRARYITLETWKPTQTQPHAPRSGEKFPTPRMRQVWTWLTGAELIFHILTTHS